MKDTAVIAPLLDALSKAASDVRDSTTVVGQEILDLISHVAAQIRDSTPIIAQQLHGFVSNAASRFLELAPVLGRELFDFVSETLSQIRDLIPVLGKQVFPQLTTHRDRHLGPEALSYFQYEAAIAAIAIWYCRTTVHLKYESVLLRWFFAILLAGLAYTKQPYEYIFAVELFSYAVAWIVQPRVQRKPGKKYAVRVSTSGGPSFLSRFFYLLLAAIVSGGVCHFVASEHFPAFVRRVTPDALVRLLYYLFPVAELGAAHDIMASFANPEVLEKQLYHLLFVTFHIQVGMGYMGIGFLEQEQSRKNQLVRMDLEYDDSEEETKEKLAAAKSYSPSPRKRSNVMNGKQEEERDAATTRKLRRAKRFQRGAAFYIAGAALPYMIQIIVYGAINKFAYSCVKHDVHRIVRLNELFDHDNRLTAMASETATSPEDYAMAMNEVITTAYDLINRKLFSLPKVMLLPSVMAQHPMLIAQVFPFIFVADWLKASAVAFMTNKIEKLQKETQELRAVRGKVESFDMKNAALLRRSGRGATQFTQLRWEEMTVKIQEKLILSDLLTRSKQFFAFMQRNFVFTVLVDCALANLIALGRIETKGIFVFSRAIEDSVDLILTRSRGEAELARMMTEIDRLKELADIFERSKTRSLLPCHLPAAADAAPNDRSGIVLRNLHYSRGTASVRADHVEIPPGVYALTGANGSGKSTLFSLLMSCDTNEKSIDLPPSINLHTPAEPLMEEDDVMRETSCEASRDHNIDGDCDEDGSGCPEGGTEIVDASEPPEPIFSEMPHHRPQLSITMPSSQVVEISQTFYWPLYAKPIDWIYQEHVSETCEPQTLLRRTRLVAEELQSLEFFQPSKVKSEGSSDEENGRSELPGKESTIQRIMQELQEEKEDWFGDLSGGQRSKVELVRKVFMHDRCPAVLLVDETMAPLDPTSKAMVMAKLKQFCRDSIIIVIYHTDVGRGKEVEGQDHTVQCVPSNNFFDSNIHLEHGDLHMKDVC